MSKGLLLMFFLGRRLANLTAVRDLYETEKIRACINEASQPG